MPNIYFILFELIIYIQFSMCLGHAWKQGTANLLRLLAGILFGLMLELATIRQLHAYSYGQFLLMVLDVPFCIGVAWGCIIYSSMEFSNASSIPYWARPILDGLLALNIDLALDAVAIRLGFWDWGQGLKFQYFGVPYANFWAWFWVVFSFSLGYRLLAHREDWVVMWLSPLLALIVGLTGVLGTNTFITFEIPFEEHKLFVPATLSLALILIASMRPRFYLKPVPSLVFLVPFLTHAYILIAGLISGMIFDPPFLLLVGLLMSAIAIYLHLPTIQHFLRTRSFLKTPSPHSIIFVCEHGAAKSIIAAAYFNQLANEMGLNLSAVARGTNPDPVVSEPTIKGLSKDGLIPTKSAPQELSLEDVKSAQRVVSFCELPVEYKEIGRGGQPSTLTIEQWDGIPPVSENYDKARDAIIERLNHLLDSIRSSS